jgi:hypothetical protein
MTLAKEVHIDLVDSPAIEELDVEGDVVMQEAEVLEGEATNEDDYVAYEVEDIIDDRVLSQKRQFLVRWKGFDESFDTWQNTDECSNCPDIIKAYVTRRYHAYPDKLLSLLSSFKRPAPAAATATVPPQACPNLFNLPADVRFFHDVKNNMIILRGKTGGSQC